MTTWTIQTAYPAVGTGQTGEAAYTDSGLRIDDTVQGATGTNKSLLDAITGSTTAIKIGKYLVHLQRHEKSGLAYRAFDGVATYILPNL